MNNDTQTERSFERSNAAAAGDYDDQRKTDVAVREPKLPIEPVAQSTTTAVQAKIDAVAALTHSAYQKASQLSLTDAEIAALTADFQDEAFKPGAAGKENLIYIEHAFLRDRLNSVFRPGQWAIVPRSRWAEDFTTRKGDQASRVYVEAMLCIRGCFAAEAVGEMEYYPNNASQNYGDAVEGAKTAALRRCCKELGIGLQAWKKDWCDGWWQRRRNGPRTQSTTPMSQASPQKPVAVLPRKPEQPRATEETKKWMFRELYNYDPALLHEFAIKTGILLPTENISDWPLNKVPTSKDELRKLMKSIEEFKNGGAPPTTTGEPPGTFREPPAGYVGPSAGTRNADDQPDDLPYDPEEQPKDDEAFKTFIVPYGRFAGNRLGDLETKTIYGFWAGHTVETEYHGKPKRPETIAKDQAFRDALDAAGRKYEFTKKD